MLPPATLIVRRATLATCDGVANDAALRSGQAVAVVGGRVAWIGPDEGVASAVEVAGAREIDAAGRLVTPGLVDCHTHLLFGDDGARAAEFAALAGGRSYEEISRTGGGIRATMRATRAASDAEFLRSARVRARRLLSWGVTTLEVKSGYGESAEEELRLLRTVRELARSVSG